MRYEPIAIIGMSGRFPEADDLDEFWNNLTRGRDSIREFPQSRRVELENTFGPQTARFVRNGYLDRITDFAAGHFGISAEEARFIDPQQRIALELIEESIQNAGYRPEQLAKTTVSTYIAHSSNQYGTLLANHPLGVVNVLDSALAGRVAYIYDFRGPAVTVNTACSSSLVALHMACMSLLTDESAYALVAGCQVFVLPAPWEVMKDYPVFAKSEKLRAFGRGADGTLGGEGGGAFLLKKLSRALSDGDVIHAVVRGSAVNSDAARSNGLSAPSPVAQAELIRQAMAAAELTPVDIHYVEAHGTGTELGDPIEVEGIARAFQGRRERLPIGAVKTNIGHLVGMAGFAGAVKVVLSLQNRQLPASLNFEEPNPHIDFEASGVYVNDTLCNWDAAGGVLRAGVSSFGIIGTNAHAIFEEAPERESSPAFDERYAVPISAPNAELLARYAASIERALSASPDLPIQDVAFTLAVGRRHGRRRACFVVGSVDELRCRLREFVGRPPVDQGGVLYVCAPPAAEYPRCTAHSSVERAYLGLTNRVGDERVRLLAWDYAHAQVLAQLGCAPNGVIGWNAGRQLANLVSGKRTFTDAVAGLASETHEPHEPKDDERAVAERLRGAIDKGYRTFLVFGCWDATVEALLRDAARVGRVHCPAENGASFLAAIAEAFERGVALAWEMLFPEGARRVPLPAMPFERQSFFALKRDLRRDLAFDNPGQASSPHTCPLAKVRSADSFATAPAELRLDDVIAVLAGFLPAGASSEVDFIGNGGDSIGIVECVDQMRERYNVKVAVDDFYEAPSLRSLGQLIMARATGDQRAGEHSPELVLPANSVTAAVNHTDDGREQVLLTGATGYLGAHVLQELATSTSHVVHCLVRGESESQARERLERRLRHYFGDNLNSFAEQRLVVWNGDMRRDRLGLSEPEYLRLAQSVSHVIHSAADVRQIAPAEQLRNVNVDGTRRVIELCGAGRAKRLHHCSTYVVSGRAAEPTTFSESDLQKEQSFFGNTYAQTKYEAELLVHEARARGLTANVFRIGNLTGRWEDGVFQANGAESLLYASFEGILMLGCYPRSLSELELEFSPVDLCARALVRLIAHDAAGGRNFHLMNPLTTPLRRVFSAMEASGVPLERIERDDEFRDLLSSRADMAPSADALKRLSLFFDSGRRSSNEPSYQPRYIFDGTLAALREVEFSWPELDAAYFSKLVNVLRSSRSVPAPREARHS